MFEVFPLPPHALDTFQCGNTIPASSFGRLNIWGNGTCFFHSIACLLAHSNKVMGDSVIYKLAIPSNKNLPTSGPNTDFQTTTKNQTVHLVFTVGKQHDPQHFYKNFEQVGLQLRQYLSETLTAERWTLFLKEAFSSDMAWSLSPVTPNWIEVKKQMAELSMWADIWVVKYAAWALSLNILFINGTSREEPIFCGIENFRKGPWTLFVFWSGKIHFEPIVQLNHSSVTSRVFQTNHPFIQCLEQRFESNESGGCKLEVNK